MFLMSGNFSIRKMDVKIDFRIITKNSAADPEIGLYVLVRLSELI